MFEGLLSVVVRGVLIYWLPPSPPLPVTLTLLSDAVPPKELIPVRLDETLNGMPEIGTFPIDVFATTSAVPLSSNVADEVSVTAAKKDSKPPLLSEVNG